MPQPQETRLLAGFIDTDSAPHLIEPGDLLASINTRGQRQKEQSGGKREWIPGNSKVTALDALLTSGTNILLGKCVDDATGCIYLCIYNATRSGIYEYDTTDNTARIVIDDTMVTGGLGWTSTMFIDCDAADSLLLWCDGTHDQRYVNLDTTYTAVTPITASQLSFVAEPGMVPPTQARAKVVGGASTIQYTPLQFAYRFTNTDGVTSVLSPYSTTALPARASDVLADADEDNAVTVTIPVAQKVPANWDRVELIARYLDSNVFYVIERWDRGVAADVTAVTDHNATTTPLTLTGWLGDTMETVDAKAASKQFDNNPIAPKRQVLAANRNVVANFYEGYDTSTDVPTIVVSNTTYVASNTPSSTNYDPFIIVIEKDDTRDWYFAIFIRFGGKNYLLPKETATGKFVLDNNTIPTPTSSDFDISGTGLFNLPSYISTENLIELRESGDPVTGTTSTISTAVNTIRKNIIIEANGLTNFVEETSGGQTIFLFPVNATSGSPATIEVEDTPSEFGPASQSRAFLPGVVYKRGLQYYDGSGRKSGVIALPSLTTPDYDIGTPVFIERTSVTVPASVAAGAIPDWAEHFSITQSRAGRAQRFGFFFGGIVKALFKTGDGTIVYGDRSELMSVPPGKTVYGIGVPIPNNFKYDYAAGDYMIFSSSLATGKANVIGVYSGHIVLQFTDSMQWLPAGFSKKIHLEFTGAVPLGDIYLPDSTHVAEKVAFTLVTGVSADDNQYEIAAFGNITGSAGNKQFGNFYANNTQSIDIYGDAHTQIRTSNAGGGLGLGMSTRDDSQSLVWVNDLGRTTPTDSVGQKRLVNAVRWSNTRIPGATINGYGSFDADDFKTVDITAGEITALALTTRGTQDGGQLLVLCEHGSFAALIGQQQIAGADGKNAFTAAAAVLGDFNALRGGWGCQSPRSVTDFEGRVWWVDAYKRAVIEFNDSGAGNIALFKAARLWDRLLGAVTDPTAISAAVDSFTNNVLVSLPTVAVTPANMPGFESVKDASDAVDGSIRTWLYDYVANRWVGGYESGAEMVRCGTSLFGWKDGGLWLEFAGTAGTYYNVAKDAVVAVAFGADFPSIKAPLALKLLGTTAPATTRLLAGGGSATVMPYRSLEGVNSATVLRNRVGGGAATTAAYNVNGLSGRMLKGEVIVAVLYYEDGDAMKLSSASLSYDVSKGH